MKLGLLSEALGIELSHRDAVREIHRLTQRASEACEQSLFVCIRGAHHDGHAFAFDAYQQGCRAFVAERALDLPPDAILLLTENSEEALGKLASAFYGHPSRHLTLIGITGTKGKTTTALLLQKILQDASIPTGYIGTNGIQFSSVRRPSLNTTPDAITLQRTLSEMQQCGIRAVILEVSSQALLRQRVVGCHFDTVLFTNLYPDHIGPSEHLSMEDYRECKHRLFTDFSPHLAVFHADSPASREMQRGCTAKRILSVSRKVRADATASNEAPDRTAGSLGVSFDCQFHSSPRLKIHLPLVGTQNVENALLALTVAVERFGIAATAAAEALSSIRIAGRSESIPLPNGALAVIDYAHNGESLSRLLTALRSYAPSRLSVLFGSVGERTQLRRRELGEAAARMADRAILTSDNPGNEDPDNIIEEIASAFVGSNTPYVCIPDRADAIRFAASNVIPGEILVLAGKGHENYQLVGKEKIPFSEQEILKSAVTAIASET